MASSNIFDLLPMEILYDIYDLIGYVSLRRLTLVARLFYYNVPSIILYMRRMSPVLREIKSQEIYYSTISPMGTTAGLTSASYGLFHNSHLPVASVHILHGKLTSYILSTIDPTYYFKDYTYVGLIICIGTNKIVAEVPSGRFITKRCVLGIDHDQFSYKRAYSDMSIEWEPGMRSHVNKRILNIANAKYNAWK